MENGILHSCCGENKRTTRTNKVIKIIKGGDVLEPIGRGRKIIAHIVNNKKSWGAGFVLELSKKYPQVENAYRAEASWYLGKNQHIPILNGQLSPSLWIINMCAQDGVNRKGKNNFYFPLISYTHLDICLADLMTIPEEFTFHMPPIGTGLGNGSWKIIRAIIEERLGDREVYIYDKYNALKDEK